MKAQLFLLGLSAAALLAGCGTYPSARDAMFDGGTQLQARSYQSRAFDTTDREQTLRGVITTLQDLGFVIDKADATLGTVSATKLWNYQVRATVSVRPRGTTQMLVRMNAQYTKVPQAQAGRPLEDPAAYQDFFTALAKTLFLVDHTVE